MNRPIPILAFIAGFLLPSMNFAADINGRITGIADGDTVTVLQNSRQFKIRLAGIDTPEKNQDFGNKAKQYTADRVFKKQVRVESRGTDRYGRVIGLVFYSGGCLNEELIRAGYAWVYGRYCKYTVCAGWMGYEKEARRKQVGLWACNNPVPPWAFRRGCKRASKSSSKQDLYGNVYRGNVKSHVFHEPGCRFYNCKNCTAAFSSRSDAIAKGYRPCGECRP